MELIILGAFCAILLGCVVLGVNILYALCAGLVLFLWYGHKKGFSPAALWQMCVSGVKTVKNILFIFLLIGMLTALWRACGTLPVIICYASALIRPASFICMAFLLCCGVSLLTGTAFGTAATMGVICATIARAMGVSIFWTGGAILAGSFFGDRCSPVSTSALLVCTLTKTDIFNNIRRMLRAALVPTLFSCGVYLLAGFFGSAAGPGIDVKALFSTEFALSPLCLVPAAAILILAVCRVPVRWTMLVSIVFAFVLALTVQHQPLTQLGLWMLRGYQARGAELAAMLDGGGIFSMVRSGLIVLIASCYAGIFEETGMLHTMQTLIDRLAARSSSFAAMLVTSLAASMISCNQTLAIMLAHQLCGKLYDDAPQLALDLEDSAVTVAPLIPWSIAAAVPLASVQAPLVCVVTAVFLYAMPLWRLAGSILKRKKA